MTSNKNDCKIWCWFLYTSYDIKTIFLFRFFYYKHAHSSFLLFIVIHNSHMFYEKRYKIFAMRFHVLLKVTICASSSCLGVLYQMIFASFEGHLRRPQICATCFTSHRIIEFLHFHGHLDFPTVCNEVRFALNFYW